MGILMALWGLIWPLLLPFSLLSKFVAENPDSPIGPVLEKIVAFISNML